MTQTSRPIFAWEQISTWGHVFRILTREYERSQRGQKGTFSPNKYDANFLLSHVRNVHYVTTNTTSIAKSYMFIFFDELLWTINLLGTIEQIACCYLLIQYFVSGRQAANFPYTMTYIHGPCCKVIHSLSIQTLVILSVVGCSLARSIQKTDSAPFYDTGIDIHARMALSRLCLPLQRDEQIFT